MIKPRKNLEKICAYETPKYAHICKLKLDSNENPYGPSIEVTRALKELTQAQIGRYPHYGVLIDKIAQKYGLRDKNVLLSNGADEALSVIINTFLDDDEELLCFMPTFSMPKIYTAVCGAKFRGINYFNKWVFDAQKLIDEVSEKTKIIYITSPNNPTGEIAAFDDIEKILIKFPNIALILDITYINFAKEQPHYWDLIKKYDNLFVVKSFSKDMGLAGLRLGMTLSSENNILECKKVISPYSVNEAALCAGIAALNDTSYEKTIKENISTARDALEQGLFELGFKPYKSEANFVLCDFLQYRDFIYTKLKMAGILTRKFENSPQLKTCLRITVPRVEDVQIFFDALKKKDLLVFDLDGVVFDVSNSYRTAIKKTFEHFSKKELDECEIQKAKELGGLNCDWDLTKYLLEKHGFDIDYNCVKDVFQKMFFDPAKTGSKGLIDNEKLLVAQETFESLSGKYDFAVFTGRPKDEAIYSLEKFGILKYFCKIITQDDIEKEKRKPHPEGLNIIKRSTIYNKIFYFGDTIDDIYSGIAANVVTFGTVAPENDNAQLLLDAGAKKTIDDISKIKDFLEFEEHTYANN